MNNFFAYGTLMCEQIFYSVTGRTMPGMPAILNNYSRHPVAGEVYPGIVQRQGASVEGIVYLDIPEVLWKRLDLFEGRMYRRETVYVHCRERGKIPAWTYIVRPQYISCLTKKSWDYLEFLSTGKEKFQGGYPGYVSIREE